MNSRRWSRKKRIEDFFLLLFSVKRTTKMLIQIRLHIFFRSSCPSSTCSSEKLFEKGTNIWQQRTTMKNDEKISAKLTKNILFLPPFFSKSFNAPLFMFGFHVDRKNTREIVKMFFPFNVNFRSHEFYRFWTFKNFHHDLISLREKFAMCAGNCLNLKIFKFLTFSTIERTTCWRNLESKRE